MKFVIIWVVTFVALSSSAENDQYQSTGSGSGNTIGSHNAQSG